MIIVFPSSTILRIPSTLVMPLVCLKVPTSPESDILLAEKM
jgi:hypothetical protein